MPTVRGWHHKGVHSSNTAASTWFCTKHRGADALAHHGNSEFIWAAELGRGNNTSSQHLPSANQRRHTDTASNGKLTKTWSCLASVTLPQWVCGEEHNVLSEPVRGLFCSKTKLSVWWTWTNGRSAVCLLTAGLFKAEHPPPLGITTWPPAGTRPTTWEPVIMEEWRIEGDKTQQTSFLLTVKTCLQLSVFKPVTTRLTFDLSECSSSPFSVCHQVFSLFGANVVTTFSMRWLSVRLASSL